MCAVMATSFSPRKHQSLFPSGVALRRFGLVALVSLMVASWMWILYDIIVSENVVQGSVGFYRLRSLFLQAFLRGS